MVGLLLLGLAVAHPRAAARRAPRFLGLAGVALGVFVVLRRPAAGVPAVRAAAPARQPLQRGVLRHRPGQLRRPDRAAADRHDRRGLRRWRFPGGPEEHGGFLGWPLLVVAIGRAGASAAAAPGCRSRSRRWSRCSRWASSCGSTGAAPASPCRGGSWPGCPASSTSSRAGCRCSRPGWWARGWRSRSRRWGPDGPGRSRRRWCSPRSCRSRPPGCPPSTPAPCPRSSPRPPRRMCPGGSVLVLPFPAPDTTEPMRWQAASGMAFAMPGGYFIGPAADGRAYVGGQPTPTGLLLRAVQLDGQVRAPDPARCARRSRTTCSGGGRARPCSARRRRPTRCARRSRRWWGRSRSRCGRRAPLAGSCGRPWRSGQSGSSSTSSSRTGIGLRLDDRPDDEDHEQHHHGVAQHGRAEEPVRRQALVGGREVVVHARRPEERVDRHPGQQRAATAAARARPAAPATASTAGSTPC